MKSLEGTGRKVTSIGSYKREEKKRVKKETLNSVRQEETHKHPGEDVIFGKRWDETGLTERTRDRRPTQTGYPFLVSHLS